jgi:thiamine transport system substrate-binding protein
VHKVLKAAVSLITLSAVLISLSGCSINADKNSLTVVIHDSILITDEQLAEFKQQTGIEVNLVKAGDAGAMTNKLILTKDQPIGDAFYGIDNTFLGAAAEAKILGDYSAIDFGDVCFNYDKTWFSTHEQAAPETIEDLIKPEFKGLTVVENPSTSSTGLAFLIATVGKYGDAAWLNYWEKLKANEVRIDSGWEEAYNINFSGSAGKGNYPIVLSYSSSPAFEVSTASIDDSCFRQTEFAGVLNGGKNPAGANKFVKYLLSDSFQNSIPEAMYMYPVSGAVNLPEAWSVKAPAAANTISVDSEKINANRLSWLKSWDTVFRN